MEITFDTLELVSGKLFRRMTEIDIVQVRCDDEIDHFIFDKVKIISETDCLIVEKIDHLLLCQRRKEQTELNFIVSVFGMKEQLKLLIAHHGEVGIIIQIAGKFFKLPHPV